MGARQGELPSRCTHVYQWMNNVLYDLFREGHIVSDVLLRQMHQQVEDMRAANVWGLPSLPMPYTLLIILMVKTHLLAMALSNGAGLNMWKAKGYQPSTWCWIGQHLQLFLSNFLYQGLLDLHGHLYNPNSGDLLGHLPVVNFLDFVKTVSENLIDKNSSLPYDLDFAQQLTDPGVGSRCAQRSISGALPSQIEMHMRRPLLIA
ncbi:unnamed protein product [Prorocentrum cordatum]|uniref:Uncharacterized protein n=1 Tax=Prorocentrum cordatum TaxID=2364126 RepID=A0ABN9X572_9DINO|nr:unnamed protein product [Polarella glacialis]